MMRGKTAGAALALLVMLASSPATATDFHLVCEGGGAAVKRHAVHGFARNSEGQTVTATAVEAYDRNYSDQVKVEIVNGAGRIRLPRGLLPPIHGGDGGWLDLHDLAETDNEVTANAAVNFVNHPEVRIDRLAGAISIDGRDRTFAGKCQPYDPVTVQRAF